MIEAETIQPPVQQDPNPYWKNVYNALKAKVKGFDLSPEDFQTRMAQPEYQKNVYNALKSKVGGFDVEEQDFYNRLKKKDEISPTSGIPFENGPETSLQIPGTVDLGKPLPELPFNEEADKQQSLGALDQQFKQQQADLFKPISPEQQNFDYYKAKRDERLLRESQGIDQKEPEFDPVVTFGKSMWNTLAYQLPAGIAAGLAAASRPSAANPENYDTEVLAQAEQKNDALKGDLLKWAEQRQGEGAELTQNLVSSLDKIHDPIDILNWMSYAGGQAAGQIPASIASFGATSIGQEVGSIYLESVQKIAKEERMTIDQVIHNDLDKPALALAYGTVAGALDYLGAKTATGGLGKAAIKKSLQGRTLEMAKTGSVEAGTEYAQQWIEQIGASQAAGDDFGKSWNEANTSEAARERIESLAQGGVGGAGAHIVTQKLPKNASPVRGDQEQVPQGGNEPASSKDQSSQDLQLDAKKEKESTAVNTPQNTGEGNLPSGDGVKIEPKNEKTKPKGTGKRKRAKVPKTVKAEQAPLPGTEKKEGEVSGVDAFVAKMKEGKDNLNNPEDLQFYENNKDEIEKRLKQLANEQGKPESVVTDKAPDVVAAPKEEQTPEKARKEGKLVKDGVTYERQKQLEGEDVVKGGPVKLEFANKVNEEAEYAVVEADKIQPSHKKGVQNAVHFLPEAQPKNRSAAFSQAGVKGAQDIAQKLEPEKVAASPNPYSGAPTVNSRGEVIQGNSRADALQQYWENNQDKDPAGYKQYLIDNAQQFGLDPEAIAKMKAPVLTRMTKASDARAIELGQYTASDIETGGKRRIEPVHTVNKLTPEDRTKLANTIAQSEGETLSEIIRANTDKILDILYKRGAISETQLETVRNPRTGEINKESVEDLARLFRHMMFEGGDTNLGEIFEHLPDAVQKGLDKAIPSIIRTHGLNKTVNNAIIGYREYQKSGMDDMNVWASQADIFNDGLSPAQVYSPEEMNLIRLMDTKKQGEISGKIKEVAAHMADKEGDMFTGPSKGLKAKEAFQKVFVDKGLPENTDSTLPITTRIRNVGKDQFAVTGDTYTIKNRIQALGGVWDKKTQRWIFNNSARPEVEKLLESVDGKNPQAQFAGQRFDGRTVKQVETALRRIGQIQMKALVKRLMSKFPGVSEVVTDKKRFEAAWLKYLASGNPEQTPAGSGVPNGFVYGDKIYLNPDTVTLDTPIHEFGHLWWNIARHKFPVLYAAGQRLIKGSSYLKEVEANPAYSSLSEAGKADEALVIAIGEKGAGIADQSAWRRFWSDLWTRLKQGLGIKQNVDMSTMTLNDLVSMAAKELMSPGEIGRISSLHMPETASFRLKGFRMGSEAWEDWNKRVEADRILNLAPETWSRGVKSLRQVFMSSFLTSTQDWTRTIHEVQKEIVDSYIAKAQEAIDALSISKQDKKQLSKELKDSRKILTERLIGDTKDVHGLLDLMTGKAEYQIKSMRKWLFGETTSESGYGSLMEFLTKATTITGKNVLDPKSLAARVNSQGLSLFDVGFYMQVVHSLERNEYNRKLTQGETQAGSGMTDTEANGFLDEIKKSGKEDALKAFAAEIRDKLVVEPLNFMHQAGILNQKEYNQLLNYYANYVPLKVQQHQKAGQQGQLSKGVFGTGVKASHGSEQNRYWDRVNPVVHLINNYEATIAKVESNEVMKKLHKLVTEHPNEQVWKIIRPKKAVTQVVKEGEEDSDGDVGEVKTVVQDFTSPEEKRAIEKESVGVRIGGKQYFIWLKDPDLRKVFVKNKTETPKWLISVMNTIRTIQNYQRATYIGLNLDFPLPNLVRDIQDAAVNLQSLEVKKIGRAVIGGIPTAMSTIFKKNIGKGSPDPVYSQYMEEMKSEGGEISWLDVAGHEEILKEVEQEIDRFKKLTPAQRGGNSLLWLPRKVMRGVVLINKVTEQAIRLSTYVNLREAGVSAHKAAKAAKNVTVNFNKKGSWGPYLNMAWLFANAGIQGANQMATALIKSPKVRAMMVGLILGQIANRFLLDALADDDDDLKKLLTESDHNKNFILWAPWSKHQVVTLPAAYNIRPFKAVGDALYDLYRNNKDFGQATSYVFKNFLNGLFPMAENNFYPSITQPFVELSQNEKFYNQQPIYPEKKHLYQKDSELYFKSTDKPFIKLSGVLSETFQGNDDILEISPATMEYGMDYTLGGLKSWYKLGDQMYNVIDKQQMDMNKMPVVRRFVTDLSTQEWRTKVAFYKLYTEFSRRRLSQEQFDFWKDLGDRLTQEGNMKPDDWNRKRKEILKVQQESFSNVLQ